MILFFLTGSIYSIVCCSSSPKEIVAILQNRSFPKSIYKGVQLKLARGGRNTLSCAREARAKIFPPLSDFPPPWA